MMKTCCKSACTRIEQSYLTSSCIEHRMKMKLHFTLIIDISKTRSSVWTCAKSATTQLQSSDGVHL